MAQTVALAAVACACLPAFAETETRRVAVYVEPLKSETTFTDELKEQLSRDFRESSKVTLDVIESPEDAKYILRSAISSE